MILNINSLDQVKHCNVINLDLETINRFWSKIDIPDDYINDCWEWQAGTNKIDNGYGTFFLNKKMVASHRLMYECYNGIIPDGLIVRHSCDHPICVNPYHLLLGTQQDNMDDMINRNRSSCGENHSSSVLTDVKVKEILNYLILNKYSKYQLSILYNVGTATISYIASGQAWKHIYNQLSEEEKELIKTNQFIKNLPCRENNHNSVLTDIKVKEILNYLILGDYSQRKLAKIYNISKANISSISHGQTWKHIYNQLSEEEKKLIKNNIGNVPSGEKSSNSVLNNIKVKEILNYLISGKHTQEQLAKMYNVGQTTISQVSLGKRWRYIYNELSEEEKELIKINTGNVLFGEKHHNCFLTDTKVKEILNHLLFSKYTQKQLSEMYNVGTTAINNIVNGRTWKHIYNQLSEQEKLKIKNLVFNKGNSILTGPDVKYILQCLVNNIYTQTELSRKYNVSIATINSIICGDNWNKLYNQLSEEDKNKIKINSKRRSPGENNGRAKLKQSDILQIRKLYSQNNITQQKLADSFGVAKITISNIVTRKTWKHI